MKEGLIFSFVLCAVGFGMLGFGIRGAIIDHKNEKLMQKKDSVNYETHPYEPIIIIKK